MATLGYTQTTQGKAMYDLAVPTAPKAKNTRTAVAKQYIPKGWQETLLPTVIKAGVDGYKRYLDDNIQQAKLNTSNALNAVDKDDVVNATLAGISREQLSKLDPKDPDYESKAQPLRIGIEEDSPKAKLKRVQEAYEKNIEYLHNLKGVRQSEKDALITDANNLFTKRVKSLQPEVFKVEQDKASTKILSDVNQLIQPRVAQGTFTMKDVQSSMEQLKAWGYTETQAKTEVYGTISKQISNVFDNKPALEHMVKVLDEAATKEETTLDTQAKRELNVLKNAEAAEARRVANEAMATLKRKQAKDKKNASMNYDILKKSGKLDLSRPDHMELLFKKTGYPGGVQLKLNGGWEYTKDTPEAVKLAFKNIVTKDQDETYQYKDSIDILDSIDKGGVVTPQEFEHTKNKEAIKNKIVTQVNVSLGTILEGKGQPSDKSNVVYYNDNPTIRTEIDKQLTNKIKDVVSNFDNKDTSKQFIPELVRIYSTIPTELKKTMSSNNRKWFALAKVASEHPELEGSLKELYHKPVEVTEDKQYIPTDGLKTFKTTMNNVDNPTESKKLFYNVYTMTQDADVASEVVLDTYGMEKLNGVNMSQSLYKQITSEAASSGDKTSYILGTTKYALRYVRSKAGTDKIADVTIKEDNDDTNYINISYGKNINGTVIPGFKVRVKKQEFNGFLTDARGEDAQNNVTYDPVKELQNNRSDWSWMID